MDKNYYVELAKIDVGEHIEKKGRFSYLSWAWAVDQLRRVDPTATWQVIRFNGMPYMKTECGYFVEVEVTCNGIPLSQIHPVLDNNNKPIAQPNAFQINTSIQRCLVKAIALHGLGLYIYAGEDLPFNEEEQITHKHWDGDPKVLYPESEGTKKQNKSLDECMPMIKNPITQKQVGEIKVNVEKLVGLGVSKKDSFNLMQLEIGKFKELTELTEEQATRAITQLENLVVQNEKNAS